jgi:hypothetical protein
MFSVAWTLPERRQRDPARDVHGAEKIRPSRIKKMDIAPSAVRVQVLWGETNTGKSHRIWHTYPDAYHPPDGNGRRPLGWPSDDVLRFRDYTGQGVLVLDSFNPQSWPVRYLLGLLSARGSYGWTKVIIACNDDPRTFYADKSRTTQEAFQRRLTVVTRVLSQEDDINLI